MIVKAEYKFPVTPSNFTLNQVYTSIIADTAGVVFISDVPAPRPTSWTELNNPAQWEIQSIEIDGLVQVFP